MFGFWVNRTGGQPKGWRLVFFLYGVGDRGGGEERILDNYWCVWSLCADLVDVGGIMREERRSL